MKMKNLKTTILIVIVSISCFTQVIAQESTRKTETLVDEKRVIEKTTSVLVDTLKTQVISTAKPETSDKTPKIIEKPTSVINSRKTNHDIAKNSVGNVK